MNDELKTTEERERISSPRWVGGAVLIVLGLLLLVDQFFDIPHSDQLVLPGLGLVFLVWGLATRNSGLLIPGGILAGIGVGVYLQDAFSWAGEGEAGIFLIAFGAGFALITLLSSIFTQDRHFWALIPGGILAAIGVALLAGGFLLDVLEYAGKFWPVILIVAGLTIIFRRRK